MKPALVLGLAFAANAMVADQGDNEFFVAPTGKLAEFARRHPEIMFDEQADDELAVKYVHLPHIPAPEYVAYDDDELLIRPLVPHIAADDAADDEFAAVLLTRDRFKTEEEYQKYYARARYTWDDAADDELAVKYVHLPHIPAPEYVAYDDDELLVQPVQGVSRYRTGVFDKIYKDGIGYPLLPLVTRSDEVADDELRIRPISVLPTAEHVAFDDDELMRGIPPVENFKSYEDWLRFTRKMSEEADNELRIRPISVLPTAEHLAFDDELSFLPIPPKVFVNRDWIKPAKIPASEALIRDDEADDELAYLGQLINDRAFARTFDDDELRAEKPSHLKAQEMAQMKSELPKMKRKFRPIIDEVPLAQN